MGQCEMTTKDHANGKWRHILQVFGVSILWVSGGHVECPFCKRKKYRYTDKTGNGDWICSCGNGNGFALVQLYLNCDFKTAAREVDKIIGRKGDSAIADEKKKEDAKLQKRLTGMWATAQKPSVLSEYLQYRGLRSIPEGLRGHNNLAWASEGERGVDRAMLAQVKKIDGTPIAIHRTFILPEGRKVRMMSPTMEPLSGAAIQLYEPGQELGIAEGIETAIACYELFDMPVWSCVSASLMESVQIPGGVERVIVFADNDKNYTGQAAAYKLANRLVLREKLECDVMTPSDHGDWLDILLKKRGG